MNVVTGMHRSGTSLVAMILDALGANFGDHQAFYSADRWNEKGYFERRDVVDLNSRILTGFARTRDPLTATLGKIRYLTMPSEAAIGRRGEALRGEIDRLAEELDHIFVKDPRFSLTLPAWYPHIRRVVICLRRPDRVAQSLRRRQMVPSSISFRFWNYHARALLSMDHTESHYVDFDVLSGSGAPGELWALTRFLGFETTEASLMKILRATFVPQLKHFGESTSFSIPRTSQLLWNELCARRAAALDRQLPGL